MTKEPWEIFEDDLAELLGGSRMPGSGNKWFAKLDVRGQGMLVSAKCTGKDGFRISRSDLAEAILATGGIGGTGDVPLWAVRLEGLDDFMIMRLSDWRDMIADDSFSIKGSSTVDEKIRRGKTPILLREEEDE